MSLDGASLDLEGSHPRRRGEVKGLSPICMNRGDAMREDQENSPSERRELREAMRSDGKDAFLGVVVAVVALVVIGFFAGLFWSAASAGGLLLALVVMFVYFRARGVSRDKALKCAFIAVFGWGRWV
ncbi:hypothetical protein I3F58_08570 [Streptomyces sp. MUM 203J]|uniref:hypothetical protein n=1 Tax=Streptomyces sp. MUM 203J TaxID=2791990 RepID=UPI001F0384B1|nr:hypothetical protein [Streptomyces sp. MUM 203J]MCH0539621.1 hypothetical protein [Streptomyces sp. MUM 203J]